MKYILLMTGTNAGFGTYQAWSEQDRQAHIASPRESTRNCASPQSLCSLKVWPTRELVTLPNRPFPQGKVIAQAETRHGLGDRRGL
jgi:hypothetical protein